MNNKGPMKFLAALIVTMMAVLPFAGMDNLPPPSRPPRRTRPASAPNEAPSPVPNPRCAVRRTKSRANCSRSPNYIVRLHRARLGL